MTGPIRHSRCGSSVLHRRISCTASLLAEDGRPDEPPSDAALQGTQAHAVFEECLKQNIPALNIQLPKDHEGTDENGKIPKDMRRNIQRCLEEVWKVVPISQRDEIVTERRVEFDHYVPDPEGAGGTSDVMWLDTAAKCLYHWDLKYGYVYVETEENAQLRINALGYIDEVSWLYDIETVRMAILQPEHDHFELIEEQVDVIRHWALNTVKPAIEEALDPARRTFNPTEKNCRFCRARADCKARYQQDAAWAVEGFEGVDAPICDFEGDALTMAQRIEMYPLLERLEKWLRDQFVAMETAVKNREAEIPGYGLVESTRTHRRFNSGVTANQLMREFDLSYADVLNGDLLSPTKIEHVLRDRGDRDAIEKLQTYVFKPPGKVSLKKLTPDSTVYDPTEGF